MINHWMIEFKFNTYITVIYSMTRYAWHQYQNGPYNLFFFLSSINSYRCYLLNIRDVNDGSNVFFFCMVLLTGNKFILRYSILVRRLQVTEFLGVPYYMFLSYGMGLRTISSTLKVKSACKEWETTSDGFELVSDTNITIHTWHTVLFHFRHLRS